MNRPHTMDLNSVLAGANLLVAAFIVALLGRLAGNPYIDRTTLLLGLLLCAQTQLALWFERGRRDPFVILLAAEMIVYYALRLCTLTLYPYSGVFDRYPYAPTDSNRAMIIILVANLFLYAGFYLVRFGHDQAVKARNWVPTAPGRTVFLLVAAVVIGYSSIRYGVQEDEGSNLASLLSFFLEPRTVIMMTLTYWLLFRESLGRGFVLAIATLLVVEMAVHTLAGSRSALVGFIESCTIVILATAGCMRFARKYLFLGMLLSPVVLLLLVVSFAISTYNRAHRELGEGASFDLSQAITSASISGADLIDSGSLDLVLPPLFARVGFFDFSAEIIAHRDHYRSQLNLPKYAASIVDNVLTPGFDVYDQPKIGNALVFIYQDAGAPSKDEVAELYQSDQLGIYGEWYALFGLGAFPLLLLLAYLLKSIFVRMYSASPFVFAMKRVVVLFVFVDLLHSYGVDWVIQETVPLAAAIFIYGFFFAARPVPGSAAVPACTAS